MPRTKPKFMMTQLANELLAHRVLKLHAIVRTFDSLGAEREFF